ncbi:ATP-dependent DNA helicase RecG [Glaciihabitans tibetensis]|uniref:Probable DNA 3'-5' helicase RecG n=1 Tax=Glaciihabitans tibetensis TaxID=1266600 RepID=A0A2T0VII8_9MICO|nr:ATP-dependent DNA helicase RecG [Glaciihabitans tibetensis]PRY69885.1 ATP-dependent DNA helicase RecG [Glaciihabitans tibetensis]
MTTPFDVDPLDVKLSTAVGGRTAAALSKGLGLETVGDLLTHFPRRYARLGELTALAELELDANVTIVAEVLQVVERTMKSKRGSIVEAKITDGNGILTLTFFNQAWRMKELKAGVRGMFSGKISDYRGMRQLAHPNYQLFDTELDDAGVAIELQKVLKPIPIYPATAAMPSWSIQDAVGLVLHSLDTNPLVDPVPLGVRAEKNLLPFSRAIELIHRPAKDADWLQARDSLRFQEAFVLQAALLQQRAQLRLATAVIRTPGEMATGFDRSLPFTLTSDQKQVGEEIARDLATLAPMNRLLQGEVGSGKTLVALRAMLSVADSGGQSALLAPTEVLAAQHLRSIVATLGPDLAARLRPTLLTGQLSAAERRKALLAAVSGSAHIVIGTHALLGDAVNFYDLGLVVVDEQHRFGVEQREALRQKGTTPPHVLVLTATPIPRTVAMTVFGDLDISTIAELPSGRVPIRSFVVPYANKVLFGRIWGRVAEEIGQGRQAFVVCPAIDANVVEPAEPLEGEARTAAGAETTPDKSGTAGPAQTTAAGATARPIATVTDITERLRQRPELAQSRIASLHGRMSSDEKDTIMRAFAAGDIDILVATTVIEVGVDVPNASTMVILDAERFGVSQLHQLRGRVGRGSVPGMAMFVTGAEEETLGRERVEAVASTLDGFELAQKDLELRREGNVLGVTQSGGKSSLRLLRVVKDEDLIRDAREVADRILGLDPTLDEHPALRGALRRRLDETEAAFLAKN